MDNQDLFRKLSSGAKFDLKKYRADAQKLQVIKTKISTEPNPTTDTFKSDEIDLDLSSHKVKSKVKSKAKSKAKTKVETKVEPQEKSEPEDVAEQEDQEITLLGSITATSSNSDRNKESEITISPDEARAIREEEIQDFRHKHHISADGKAIPDPVRTFLQLSKEYKISKTILRNLDKCGYSSPTPVQMQAIPVMMLRRHLLACAPTGSGKTAAFLVPILNHLNGPLRKGFRAVIVCPTRELARQTHRECLLLADGTGLRAHMVTKGSHASEKFGPQSSQKFDVLIATPSRLIYLLQQEPPKVELKNVEWLVIDESDKLFEAGQQGFRDQLAEIYRACDTDKVCRAMFSATFDLDVAKWAKKNLKRLITVAIGAKNSASDLVDQKLLCVGNEAGKLIAFRDLVHKGLTPPVLVFVQSKTRARELFDELIFDGINVDVITADRTELERDNVVRCFREGKIWVLICTELMGRGIDFKGINLVVNYDFPSSAITYIHRIGRTGRAGRPGSAVTFFTREDSHNLKSIAQVMKDSGCDVPDYMLNMEMANKFAGTVYENRTPRRGPVAIFPVMKKRRNSKNRKPFKTRKRGYNEAASEISSDRPTKLSKKAKNMSHD